MKICIAQPEYSADYSRSDKLFEKQLELFAQCDDSMDIIVFPESCDIPCLAKTKEDAETSVEKYNKRLLAVASQTAKRCKSLLFINARSQGENGQRNTTYAFNREGEIVGKYYKQHLTPGEVSVMQLDSDYSFTFSEPTIIEIEGIRFGFLVCYDAYFYEAFDNMARQNLDVIWYNKYLDEHTNGNPNHVRLYNEFVANPTCDIQPEEPACCQQLYGILANCIQEVWTDENADCAAIMEKANADFQRDYLDTM